MEIQVDRYVGGEEGWETTLVPINRAEEKDIRRFLRRENDSEMRAELRMYRGAGMYATDGEMLSDMRHNERQTRRVERRAMLEFRRRRGQ